MTTRRELLIAIGAGTLTAPLDSYAQQRGKIWRVGVLSGRKRPVSLDSDVFGGFLRGMREHNYIEGTNLLIEWRFADGQLERLAHLAVELVQLKVDVIVSAGTPATRAAQTATSTIPIVMAVGDPVADGLVKSLARPGGNITGISNVASDISQKLLELLHRMAPKLSRVGVLVNPANAVSLTMIESIRIAAPKLKITILRLDVRNSQEIEYAFSKMAQQNVGAVIFSGDSLFIQQQRQIAELATHNRLLSITMSREYAEIGGLMAYGQDNAESFHRIATYADKIFKGAKPSDLPVEQPMKLSLVINGRTAKTLGIKIPADLLILANKVIE